MLGAKFGDDLSWVSILAVDIKARRIKLNEIACWNLKSDDN